MRPTQLVRLTPVLLQFTATNNPRQQACIGLELEGLFSEKEATHRLTPMCSPLALLTRRLSSESLDEFQNRRQEASGNDENPSYENYWFDVGSWSWRDVRYTSGRPAKRPNPAKHSQFPRDTESYGIAHNTPRYRPQEASKKASG